MRRRSRIGLATKLDALVLAFGVMTTLSVLVFVVRLLGVDAHESLAHSARDLASVIGRGSQHAIWHADRDRLVETLGSLAAHPELVYARILDADGQPLAGRALVEGARPGEVDARLRERALREGFVELPPAGRIIEVLVPVRSIDGKSGLLDKLAPGTRLPGVLGFVQLGVGQAAARKRLDQRLQSLAAFGVGLLLFSGLATLLGLRRVVGPIRRLSLVTREMAAGNFDARIDVTTQDEAGELSGAVNTMLSRLRAYRDEVHSHRRDLELQVDERTRELRLRSEEAVELARQAEAASRAKSQFLANMSHEIRTPMNGVLGMTELLLATEQSETQRKFTRTVHQSARTLLAIIDDILDFSRAEAGRLEIESEPLDLRETVEDVIDLLVERAHAKGLELACFVDDSVPRRVRADSGRLKQVLTNLLSNAVKFTERGEVVLRVLPVELDRSASDAQGRAWIEFSVTDTGIGVRPEARGHIFQSFTQADGSMARRYGGTGLGLAICRQLVELMGGEIDFETEENLGSRFFFRLPLEVEQGSPAASARRPELAGKRVLLFEAATTNREVLAHQLREWGAEVQTCDDVGAALSALHPGGGAVRCALLIIDLTPGAPGLNLLQRLRSAEPESVPPIIALQGIEATLRADVGERPAIAACVSKPPRGDELAAALLAVLGGVVSRRRREPAKSEAPNVEGAKVLVAEDNPTNREVAAAMLESLGCAVSVATDGAEALALLEASSFELVFMDCQMPGVDGFAATREIRARESSRVLARHMPVIALTAHALPSDREACLAAGMDDYLSKPFTRDELAQMVAKWTRGANASSRPRGAPATGAPATRAPEGATRESPLDATVLGALRALDDDSSLLARLVDTYLESSSSLLASIEAGFAAADAAAIARAAHTLKSSSGQIGALALASMTKEIEARARAGELAQLEAPIAQLRAELASVHEALAARAFGAGDE